MLSVHKDSVSVDVCFTLVGSWCGSVHFSAIQFSFIINYKLFVINSRISSVFHFVHQIDTKCRRGQFVGAAPGRRGLLKWPSSDLYRTVRGCCVWY